MPTAPQLRTMLTAALFAAAIAVTTAYIIHIPLPTGGYIHPGDALIYLAACLLPTPWAVAAAAVGAGLADLLTAPQWVLPTLSSRPFWPCSSPAGERGCSQRETPPRCSLPPCSPPRCTALPPGPWRGAPPPSCPNSWARWSRAWPAA